ncbi:DUF4386 family protein [Aquimarina gracilis]|uniref:DUF4386 family protein n=1 Tax=Aquimarina gracilis TaxID=874422 RepID=A0ABU6A260_9FLAO|nr:DUF4386 family protein [Aquimarina gracilis]MEB3348140.1 DUF4386 family protein [Aquimarina gracilis]
MKALQKLGGAAAILEGITYIILFIFYGAIIEYPEPNANPTQRLTFLSNNVEVFSILNFMGYVLFGVVLAILVIAIYERMKQQSPYLSKTAAVFGLLWVGLVIASGMISNIGLQEVIMIGTENPEEAMTIWSGITIITEGIGGGNEIVGGIWVLLLSFAALQGKNLPKLLVYLGILVGTIGILTVFPQDIFKEVFGITQIIWFIWLGVFMIRNASEVSV